MSGISWGETAEKPMPSTRAGGEGTHQPSLSAVFGALGLQLNLPRSKDALGWAPGASAGAHRTRERPGLARRTVRRQELKVEEASDGRRRAAEKVRVL